MENILEDLKKYFRETPREEVLKGWKKAKENAPKGGPKLNEFLCFAEIQYGSSPSQIGRVTINGNQPINNKPEEISSGFVFL
ncbi:hypothetical protein [Flavobacterium sp.]|uniref:hypothetical protein n=1 Tax=Flavobacterium sp. TaxID=239 RepID=UPI0031E26EE5